LGSPGVGFLVSNAKRVSVEGGFWMAIRSQYRAGRDQFYAALARLETQDGMRQTHGSASSWVATVRAAWRKTRRLIDDRSFENLWLEALLCSILTGAVIALVIWW
jgi:hypothetical protein